MRKSFIMLGLIAGTFALQSCIDNDYDLDNIDMTLGTTGDITLPASSTNEILLKNIMDLEDDGVVQFIDDGNGTGDSLFAVIQDGKADIDDIDIEKIEITGFTLPDFSATVNLNTLASAPAKAPRKVTLNLNGTEVDIDKTYRYTANAGDAFSKFNQNSGSVSGDVRSIQDVTLNDATATLSLRITGVPSWITHAHMENIKLNYPSDMNLKSATLNGEDIPAANITKGTVIITGADKRFDVSKPIVLTLTFDKITVGNEFIFNANSNPDLEGKVEVSGKFEILGSFCFKTDEGDINKTALQTAITAVATPAQLLQLKNGTIDLFDLGIMPSQIQLNGPTSFPGNKVEVKALTGKVRHKVAEIEPIKLDDLPDFLDDDDVVLDLSNPIILIKAQHELPAAANTALKLKSTIGNTTHTVAANVSIPGKNTINTYYLADAAADVKILPTDYKTATKLTHTGKVKDLIERIPDSIEVDVDAVELDVVDFDITQRYKVNIEYEVFAPLYIGQDFQLVYRDTDRGWAEDLEDVDGLNFGGIEIKANAYSDLPADIALTLDPIDESGNKIPQLTVSSITVPAKAQNYPVTFKLEPNSGKTINDAFKGTNGVNKLDGIRYEARIKGNPDYDGNGLPQTAKIQLKDILITIKGGITYDAN